MSIEPEYWRSSNVSDIIVECISNPENCIGGVAGNNVCKLGHIGALCEDCDIENTLNNGKYSHSSDYECVSCEEIWGNIVKIILIFLL